jgi:thymidine kinase
MANIIMSCQPETAYLEIIIGGMYAGKTSRLVEIYKQCNFCNIPVTVINHSIDNRYGDDMLSTHDQIKIPCIKTEHLFDILTDLKNEKMDNFMLATSNVILINEGQFFDDLYNCVLDMLKQNKRVCVAGLDGDFQRSKFGQMLDLIPICDSVTKLTSLCSICKNGAPGLFSLRLTKETQQTLVGSDNYIPVCRGCYDKNSS